MLWTFSQVVQAPTLDSLKDATNVNSYLLYGLFTLAAGAFAYLLASIKEKDKGKDRAVDKMVEIMAEVIKKSDERHEKQVAEHDRDREAFLTSTGEIKNAIVEAAKVSTAIVHELTNLKEEFKRSGERGIRQ